MEFNRLSSSVSLYLPQQDISQMKNVISRVKGSQPAPILLVANKLDLDCQREVSREEGECATTTHRWVNEWIDIMYLYIVYSL